MVPLFNLRTKVLRHQILVFLFFVAFFPFFSSSSSDGASCPDVPPVERTKNINFSHILEWSEELKLEIEEHACANV